MIEANGLYKSYGSRTLFEDASFTVADGERVGVLGRNGSGKTTLFRLLLDEERPDSGIIRVPKGYRVGCLPQQIRFAAETVLEEAARDMPRDEHGLQSVHEAEALLQGLGFMRAELSRPPTALSGGFQVRLQLARLLLAQPNLLLLDEPTNYLDVVSLRWIEGFLRAWPGELMLISHDRAFMDSVTTHTLGIHRCRVRKISGSSVDLERLIAQEEQVHEQTRVNQERRIAQTERFIERFRAKATKARAVQSRIKALERTERLEELASIAELEFKFRYQAFSGKWPLQIDNLSFGFEPGKPLVEGLSVAVRSDDRIGVIGRNGKGKTTLLRLLAGELQPQGGAVRLSSQAVLGYFGQTNIERLDPQRTVEEEVLAVQPENSRSAVRGICGLMMFSGDDALKPIRVLSGGERSRVLLGKLLAQPANVLLLDEPTNHLDMPSTEALVEAAADFPGAVIVVTHSEMILRGLAERLIVFDGGKCTLFEGGYDDFLERLGWQEERSAEKAEAEQGPGASRRDQRKRRAEFVTRRGEVMRPLSERVSAIEARITQLEEQLKKDEAALVEIAQGAYRAEAAAIAKAVNDGREEIERLFTELEEASNAMHARQREFAAEAKDLGLE